jgi:hypothetical protein
MDFLATSTSLGTLEVLEVYVEYNGPRLLACKNQASKVFFALWVDEEEDSDLWLYMLVSLDRLQSIRTGQISLHEAFSKPENSLYEVTYTHVNSEWCTRQVAVDDLDRDCLPLEDTFLRCDPKTLPQLESQKVIQNAILKRREIINLVLKPLSNYPNEFPAFELGKILSTFQLLINQLSTLANADSGLGSKDISKKSEFNVFAASPGSFQIELASSVFEIIDFFGNSLAGNAIEHLFHLIRIGSDANELQSFMLQAKKKTAPKYRVFLEALISSGTGLKIEWGSPTLTRGGSAEASLSSISETLELIKKIDSLEEKEYEIVGELFKVDKDSWKFGIRELRTKSSYKGDILDQAQPDAGTATISRLYVATILEVPEIAPTTNDIKSYYKLAALRPYDPPNKQLNFVESI